MEAANRECLRVQSKAAADDALWIQLIVIESPEKDAATDDGTFNKRDITPVGHRHTPVEKGERVPADLEATASRARNQHRRIKYQQTDSD